MKKHFVFIVVAFLVGLTFATLSRAATLTLQWDPVDGADGYKVYYGSQSRQYQDPVDSDGQTTLSLPLDTTNMKYIAVTAHNKWGESDFSEEAILLDAPKWKTILKVR